GNRTVVKLSNVNTNPSTWEIHIEMWPWTDSTPPSSGTLTYVTYYQTIEAEWLFYNSTSNNFIQYTEIPSQTPSSGTRVPTSSPENHLRAASNWSSSEPDVLGRGERTKVL